MNADSSSLAFAVNPLTDLLPSGMSALGIVPSAGTNYGFDPTAIDVTYPSLQASQIPAAPASNPVVVEASSGGTQQPVPTAWQGADQDYTPQIPTPNLQTSQQPVYDEYYPEESMLAERNFSNRAC